MQQPPETALGAGDMSYSPPDWSGPPLFDFSLEVIKEGTVLSEIELKNKEFFVLGRQHDVVDIPLDHPSVSRRHAVLNFRKDGSLLLKDLNSAQGTAVNKKTIPKDVFVPLNVGDVIRFAASTRIYVVKGPDELQPGELLDQRLEDLRRAAERNLENLKKKAELRAAEGVLWGMDLDDEAVDEDSDGGAAPKKAAARHTGDEDEDDEDAPRRRRGLKLEELPEYLRKDENYDRKYGDKFSAHVRDDEARSAKDREVLDKIRKKERKIQNMQEENRRIFLKEHSQDAGLTEGQLAAVARNDKSIGELSEEIQQMARQIRAKYEGSEGNQTSKDAGKKRKANEEDDDVLDTTSQTVDTATNWRLRKKMLSHAATLTSSATPGAGAGGPGSSGAGSGVGAASAALTYEEIQEALEACSTRQATLLQSLQRSRERLQTLRAGIEAARGRDDGVEVVIQQNELDEAERQRKGWMQDEVLLMERTAQLRALLAVAAPALRSLARGAPSVPPLVRMVSEERPVEVTAASLMPPPLSPPQPLRKSLGTAPPSPKAFSPSAAQAKTSPSRTQCPPVPPARARSNSYDIEGEEEYVPPLVAPTVPNAPIAVLDPAPGQGSEQPREQKSSRPAVTKEPVLRPQPAKIVGPQRPVDSNLLQGGDYVWVPPKQQKGDGRTSLNDKYGY